LLIRATRITLTEDDAEPSPRASSGFSEVGVLRRRLATGTTAASLTRAAASAVATRSGAAGHDRNNRGSQVFVAAISDRVIRGVWKTSGGRTRDSCP
jgi:hypothetical protein